MTWFEEVKPGKECDHDTRCPAATPDGNCDQCETIDGRYMSEVNEYASTCDGPCADLTSHVELTMDPETQLGYCADCIPTLPAHIQERLEQK